MKTAVITTAHNMSDETYASLCRRLSEKYGELACERRFDDAVLGGFTVNMDGMVYDCTVKTRLDQMKRHLTNA